MEQIVGDMPYKCVRVGARLDEVKPFLPSTCQPAMRKGLLEIDIRAVNASELLQDLVGNGVNITHFELARPTLHDIFLDKVGEPV